MSEIHRAGHITLAAALLVSISACAPKPSPLDGDWLVQQIAGAPLAAEERIYFAIDTRAGTLRGSTGCNDFHAELRLFEDAVTIGNIAEEAGACPSAAAQTNEARLLAVLPSVARYVRHGASLELLAGEPQPDALLRLRADDFATPAQ